VSPQNVLVLHEGPVKVVDFGIAKINTSPDHQTRTGMIKGKIHYMPPEQLLGESTIDRRADVFAVGVMLWEALAGHRMWDGNSEGKVIRALARGDLPKLRDAAPDVSEKLEAICEKALAIDRNQRYATAEEMQIELERALHEKEGYVQPRELNEFMLKNFGDRRQFQQRTVERALRSPATTMSGVMECVTPVSTEMELDRGDGPNIEASEEILSEAIPGMSSSRSSVVSVQQSRSWTSALLVAAGFSALLVGGIWLSTRNDAPAPTPVAPAPQTPIELVVVAHPANAEVFVDGNSIGTGRVSRQYAPSEETARVEVRLKGHLTEQRTVRLSRDTTLEIVLRPEPTVQKTADAAPAAKTEPEKARATATPPPRGRVFTPRTVKPAPAEKLEAPTAPANANANAAPAPNCNPPYKLSADGVKVFKPECF